MYASLIRAGAAQIVGVGCTYTTIICGWMSVATERGTSQWSWLYLLRNWLAQNVRGFSQSRSSDVVNRVNEAVVLGLEAAGRYDHKGRK